MTDTVSNHSDRSVKAARIISVVFNPLLLPILVFGYASVRLESDPAQILLVNTIGFVFFVLIPFIIITVMKRNRLITSIDIKERATRNMPFIYGLLSMGCGLMAFQLLPIQNGLIYMVLCMISINNTTIAAFINLKWKISVHAIAMGTTAVIIYYLSGPIVLNWPSFSMTNLLFISVLVILLVMVQTARVVLEFHTQAQVISGGLLSIILTVLQVSFLIPDADIPIFV